MEPQSLVDQLIALPDPAAQRAFLTAHAAELDDAFADALKAKADAFLRSDLQRSLQMASLLCSLPEFTGNPCHRALGLLAEANARSIGGLGEYQRAVELYDEAAQIYQACGRQVEQAKSQVGKVWSLASLGRYDEAFEAGAWASRVLQERQIWRPLATLTMNLAVIHGRRGDDSRALEMLDRAYEAYLKLGSGGEPFLPRVEGNRAIVLRNLGQFEVSIRASLLAQDMFARLNQPAEVAQAKQNLGITYYVLGRYNEALVLFDEVRTVWLADGRRRDVVHLDLAISDCLLQVRRFSDVVERCRRARDLFADLGTHLEAGQAILHEAAAYVGLQRYVEAMASLDEARRLFREERNDVWEAYADLQEALMLGQQGHSKESLAIAQRCQKVLKDHELPVAEAQADLAIARALLGLGCNDPAREAVVSALAVGEDRDLPALLYQGYHLMGALAESENQPSEALIHYARAISELERLRGRTMIEFRADFLGDKESLYKDMVELCVALDQPTLGLEYVERAKSRALIDLLAFQLDMNIQPRDDGDRPLTEKLAHLRSERDRLHRRWLVGARFVGHNSPYDAQDEQAQRELLDLERQITELWHQLLVRRAEYASDVALCHVKTEPFQPLLPSDTLLLEWFIADRCIILFLVTAEEIEVRRLPVDTARIQRLLSLFWLNLDSVHRNTPDRIESLAANARGLLGQLYKLLIAPVSDIAARYPRLIFVPHGPLHYLPFHALHDGAGFLVERHEISYLPAGSLLRFCCSPRIDATGALVLGYSCDGRLPHAVQEARIVAGILKGRLCADEDATLAQLRAVAGNCRVLHLATHGDFRNDSPLFSGLALADGYLTTLECFNLHLNASLVTLSGCQTGRSVVGGGDELLGLTRGLLAAGAASLVLSLWAVEDRSTTLLMTAFYRGLKAGGTKGESLRRAQLEFIQGQRAEKSELPAGFVHPYFWAPFFLVGDAGRL